MKQSSWLTSAADAPLAPFARARMHESSSSGIAIIAAVRTSSMYWNLISGTRILATSCTYGKKASLRSATYECSMLHAVAFSSSAEVRMVIRLLPCPRMLTVTLSIPSSSSWSPSSSSTSVTCSSGSSCADASSGGMTNGRYGWKCSPRHLQMRAQACSMKETCGSSVSSSAPCCVLMSSSITSLASGPNLSLPTATPISEMHSIALPRSMRYSLPPELRSSSLRPGIKAS
mmetsp:Transcript_12840/g.41014  ORF Transcript_12840/g.41014 Transcript_12840/m.41014 type:complete len:231 (-) Transcript_12840:1683-2375(-)